MAIVRVLALAQIACDPDARVPEECVDQEITSERKCCKEFCPAPRRNAGREDRVGEVRSRCAKNFNDSAPKRTITEINPGLEYEHASNNSQNEGPQNL